MSKQKARRRAEQRAKKRAPKARDGAASTTGGHEANQHDPRKPHQKPGQKQGQKKKVRSAREQRKRRRLWVVFALWLVANALIWIFTDTWNARWFGLTITTITVPLIVWLVWDPERRVHL
jgi:Flp pilus assembly protein TadB